MTHVSAQLNNQNEHYVKYKVYSNKTVCPHPWNKTGPRMRYSNIILLIVNKNNHQSSSLIVNDIRLVTVLYVFYCFFDNRTSSHNTDNM